MLHSWSKLASPVERSLGIMFARYLAYAILGHHGHLPDAYFGYASIERRLSEAWARSLPPWDQSIAAPLPSPMDLYKELLPLICREGRKLDPFLSSFAVRMLHSCLVDADYLDTESFLTPKISRLRDTPTDIPVLAERLESYLQKKSYLQPQNITPEQLSASMEALCSNDERKALIQLARRYVLEQCGLAADAAPGLFFLTVPTGGGKTLSSIFFALRHAQKYGLKRVIYVMPYTCIIEQTATLFREILGEDAVLEHHCNFDFSNGEDSTNMQKGMQYRLSTENWQASIIITTNVQFFESFFSSRPSRCRKLHNVAGSVIVLDEAQMLPAPYIAPCVEVLQALAAKYGCSVVLCTATQPALMQSKALPHGFAPESVRNLVPDASQPLLFAIFDRVQVHFVGKLTDKELVSRIQEKHTVLCILNTRRHACDLFAGMEKTDENLFLSAGMTPAHRNQVLQRVRERLALGLPCRLISTSLVECGVDISFPVVYRERNGLDNIAQSAGRCNRHGELHQGNVFVFNSEHPIPSDASSLFRKLESCALVQNAENLFAPETMQKYFSDLYNRKELLDEKFILDKVTITPISSAKSYSLPYELYQLDADFREIDRAFKFIGNHMGSVVIESQLTEELRNSLNDKNLLSPQFFRRLQMYSVQIYLRDRDYLLKNGKIKIIHDCIYMLINGEIYDSFTGISRK